MIMMVIFFFFLIHHSNTILHFIIIYSCHILLYIYIYTNCACIVTFCTSINHTAGERWHLCIYSLWVVCRTVIINYILFRSLPSPQFIITLSYLRMSNALMTYLLLWKMLCTHIHRWVKINFANAMIVCH
jgi:hypothetical protein